MEPSVVQKATTSDLGACITLEVVLRSFVYSSHYPSVLSEMDLALVAMSKEVDYSPMGIKHLVLKALPLTQDMLSIIS